MTDSFVRGLISEYNKGFSIYQLSVEFGIPKSTIRSWLVKAGVTLRNRGGRIKDDEELAAMRSMHHNGATYAQVARAFGCTRQNVQQRLQADKRRRTKDRENGPGK